MLFIKYNLIKNKDAGSKYSNLTKVAILILIRMLHERDSITLKTILYTFW